MNRDEFIEQYYAISGRALAFIEKARREGLLSLEDEIDRDKADERDIFEYGVGFAVDGLDRDIIDGLLSNIIAQEKDENVKLLKQIQLEAVLSIQAGDNPRISLLKLNSYTDLSIKEDAVLKKYLE